MNNAERIYTAGMQLAHALRIVNKQEEANDLEVWVLDLVRQVERMPIPHPVPISRLMSQNELTERFMARMTAYYGKENPK